METDIVFGTGGQQALHLDLTHPTQGTGPFPALVLVHGGGWVSGGKEDMRSFLDGFAQMGIVCVSVEYRLAPKDIFPAQIEDVKCAVRWLHANAAKYHIDPTRIGALGASAGAHLVALLGTTNGTKKWEGTGGNPGQSSAICAMVCWSGPYDFPLAYRDSVHQDAQNGEEVRKLLPDFLGGTPTQVGAQYQAASPIRYASKKTVPTLLIHGTADPLVLVEQADVFAARLKKVGASVDLLRIEGAGHVDLGKNPQETLGHIADFVKKYLLDAHR